MIRYPKALDSIQEAIPQDWLDRAEERTAFFVEQQCYLEQYTDARGKTRKLTPFWSEVKRVYMRRQYNKCIYCETKLEGSDYAIVQWDMEHFRPKSNVRKWQKFTYSFSTGDDWPSGYYRLAYHLHNYAVACKTCNSSFKSDYFPVAAARIADKPDPADYRAEEAFLVYPLGVFDEDPEDLLTFEGVTVFPTYTKTQHLWKWKRGQIIIDFFGLNRDGLHEARARWLLQTVWPNIVLAAQGNVDAASALELLRSEKSQFTNCVRCFLTKCEADLSVGEKMLPVFRKILSVMEGR